MNLIETTYALLDASTLPLREISAGSRVDHNWLIKFKYRSIAFPGAARVQNVHDFLSTGRKVASKPVRIRSQSHPRRLREAANA
jgi:hypothetical protein